MSCNDLVDNNQRFPASPNGTKKEAETRDVATSPLQYCQKKKCSHIKSSYRRSSSRGSFSTNGSMRSSGMASRRSRAFSMVAFQSYFYFFWPTPLSLDEDEEANIEDNIMDEDEEVLEEFESGCCNLWTDRNVGWFQLRTRYTVSSTKFKVFAFLFFLLSAETFGLYKIGEDPFDPRGIFSLFGGTVYFCASLTTLLALWKHAKITLFLQLLFASFSLLHALVWILVFQVILVLRIDAVRNLAKELNQTFPLILSAKYLTAGLGSVMGILSGALAVFAMREMRDNAMEKSPGANMTSSFYGIPSGAGSELQRKVSFYPAAISSTVDHSRRLSSEQQQNDSPTTTEKQAVKTFTAATGLIETTF